MAPTLLEIARGLELNKQRVEKWLSRGHIRPADRPDAGLARDWSAEEVFHLGVMAALSPALPIMQAAEISRQVSADDAVTNGKDHLIVWQGFVFHEDTQSHIAAGDRDHWWHSQETFAGVPAFFERHEVDRAVVVPLGTIITRVQRLMGI